MTASCLCVIAAAALHPAASVGQSSASGLALGAHLGFSVGGDRDGLIEERAGVQLLVPIAGPIELSASTARFFSFPESAGPAVTGSGWRTIVMGRVRPRGRGTFLSVGAGFTTGRLHRVDGPSGAITWWETVAAAMVGVEAPLPVLRPFAEFYVFGTGSLGTSALLGVNLRPL